MILNKSITGENIKLSDYKDKTVLLVNVASNCGFTKQYTDLQNLYEKYQDQNFIVLGVQINLEVKNLDRIKK